MKLSASEQLLYSTIRIECDYNDGTQGGGTGFFFRFLEDKASGYYLPVIITNKHVIEDSSVGRLLFSRANENNEPIDTEHVLFSFDNFESFWTLHPDPDVDLCVAPIPPLINEHTVGKLKPYFLTIDKSLIPSPEKLAKLSAFEDILMIGYPDGIWDEVNNKPILRKGVTSTHPNLDYNGKKEIMIDAACFPGSSGSPVFVFNEGGYLDKWGTSYQGSSRVILLGVLYAGPQSTVEGEIKIVNINTGRKPIAFSQIPNNLGYVIKSERILELERLFE